MENMNMAIGQQKTEAESAGNAMTRYATFTESTTGKLNNLKNTIQRTWMQLVNSQTINNFIDGMTNTVKVMQQLATTSRSSAVALIALATASILIVKNFGTVNVIISQTIPSIIAYVAKVGVATAITNGLSVAVGLLSKAFAFLLSPAGLVIAAIGAISFAIINHVQHEKNLKDQTDSLATSYKNLTEAMKTNNTTEMKTNSDSLKGTQTNLENLLKQKQDLQNKIASTDTNDMAGRQKVNEMEAQLEKTNSLLSDQKKELDSAGVKYNALTGEIYSVTQAEKLLNSQAVFDKANENIKYYNTLLEEAKTKGTLTADSVNEIKQSHLELLPALDLLKNKDGELYNFIEQKITEETNKEAEANKVKIENDAGYYNSKIKADSTLRNVILQNTKGIVDAQGKAYGVDINNYATAANLKIAIDNKARALIGDGWSKMYGSMQEGANQALKFYSALGSQESMFTQGQSSSFSSLANRLSGVVNTYKQLDVKYESLGGAGGYNPETISDSGVGADSNGDYMPGGGGDDSKSKSAKQTTGWIQNPSTKKWYYYKDGKMCTGWVEVDSKWYYLGSDGVMQTGWIKDGDTWYYLGTSGDMYADRWAGDYHLSKSGAMDKGTITSDEYVVDSNGKWNGGASLTQTQKTIDDFETKTSNTMANLDYEDKLLPSDNVLGKADLTKKKLSALTDEIKNNETALKYLKSITVDNADAQATLDKAIADTESKIISEKSSVVDLTKSLKDSYQQQAENIAEQAVYGDQTQKQYEYDAQVKMNAIQDQIDALEKENDLQAEQEQRIQNQNDLMKIQTELTNTMNEKNVRLLTQKNDGSYQWKYVADQNKIADLEKQKQDKIDSNNKWELDIAKKHQIDMLNQQKQAIQDELDFRQKSLEEIKFLLTDYFGDGKTNGKLGDVISKGLDNTNTLTGNKFDAIVNTAKGKIAQLNDALAQIDSLNGQIEAGGSTDGTTKTPSTTSSGGSNIITSAIDWVKGLFGYADGTLSADGGLKKVDENGIELRVLNNGDGVATSEITKNINTLGSLAPELIKSMDISKNIVASLPKIIRPNIPQISNQTSQPITNKFTIENVEVADSTGFVDMLKDLSQNGIQFANNYKNRVTV